MSRVFAQDVELTFKVFLIEFSVLTLLRVCTVGGLEDDEWLKDDGFTRESGRSEDRVVGRNVTPTENSQFEFVGHLGESLLLSLELRVVAPVRTFGFAEEDVSNCILSLLGKFDTNFTFSFSNEETVRKSNHYSCTISITTIGTSSTSVSHVA